MSEPFIGQIMMAGFNFPPRGWAECNGQTLDISNNTALFSLLGTTYGGDGQTTFRLPDLRGRVPVHQGAGPGLPNVSMGETAGNHQTTLNTNNLAPHSHTATVTNTLGIGVTAESGDSDDPDGGILSAGPELYSSGAPDSQLDGAAIQGDVVVSNANTGSSTPFSNMQPYQGINFVIALTGIFPSRNRPGVSSGPSKMR